MKVLYVIPSYEPAWAFGGTVTATSQLCRGLAKKGIDISVYTTDADGKGAHLDVTLGKVTELGGVKVTYFRCDYGVRKAFYSKSLAARLDETIEEFDLVHVSAIWQWIQRNVYRACKKYGKAYVVTPNGSFKHYPWRKGILGKRLYWHLVGKTSVRNAAALHFTTEAEREDSLSNLKMLRGIPNFVVPNGMQLGRGSRQKDVRRYLE